MLGMHSNKGKTLLKIVKLIMGNRDIKGCWQQCSPFYQYVLTLIPTQI